MDTVVTKKDDFNNPINVAKILRSFSSRKCFDRPPVDQFSKKRNLSSNAKTLDPKRNFVTFPSVQAHRYKNPKNVIISHSNVNSLRNKLVTVEELIENKIDVCLISETTVGKSFRPNNLK